MNTSLLTSERIYAFDSAWPVLLWVSVALLAVLAVVGIVLKVMGMPTKKYVAYAGYIFLVYAAVVVLVLLGLAMARNSEYRFIQAYGVNKYLNYFVFLPVFATVAYALTAWLIQGTLIAVKAAPKAQKTVGAVLLAVGALLLVATVVLCIVYGTVMVKL